jgi:hypothetical protein
VISFGWSPSNEQKSTLFGFFTVEVHDAVGEVDTSDNSTQVTLSLLSGTGSLRGTLTKIVANGLVVFDDLSYDLSESIVLEAKATGKTSISKRVFVSAPPESGLPFAFLSVDSIGVQGDGSSGDLTTDGRGGPPAISADGRYVAFHSVAGNLVNGDTNGMRDIFVSDRVSGQISRISVSSVGEEGAGSSIYPSISANGRYVVFESTSSNLVDNTPVTSPYIYFHDRETKETQLVSGGREPYISSNGRYVTFRSISSNLVPGDTNSVFDVFLRDMARETTTRISISSNGSEGNSASGSERSFSPMSSDGRYVAFASEATNFTQGGDTNSARDIFLHDRDFDGNGVFDEVNGTTTKLVSQSAGGAITNGESDFPSISADGRHVAFYSSATNLDALALAGIFVRDIKTDQTHRVSGETGILGWWPWISGNGRFVAFSGVEFQQNIFLHDRDSDGNNLFDEPLGTTTVQISVNTIGGEPDASSGGSHGPMISADASYITFVSDSSDLIAGDNNGWSDAFITSNPLTP